MSRRSKTKNVVPGPGRPLSQEQQKRDNRLLDVLSDGFPHSLADLSDHQVDSWTLLRNKRAGVVSQLHRGVYQAADAPYDKSVEIAAASLAMPNAIVAFTTAANLHGLTVEQPGLWLLLPKGNRVPGGYHGDSGQIHWSRQSSAFSIGVTTMTLAGVEVPVTSPARTIVDLWRCHRSSRNDLPDLFYEAFSLFKQNGFDLSEVGDIADRLGRLDNNLKTLIESSIADPEADGPGEEMTIEDIFDDEPDNDLMATGLRP